MNKLKCKMCGFEGMSLTTHLKFKHNITTFEYKEKYNEKFVYLHSDELKEKISKTLKKLNKNKEFRKKNSDIQKNGASRFTKKYWIKRGFTEEEAKLKISEIQKKNGERHLNKNNLKEYSHFCVEYWMKKGITEEEARKKISKIQSKLSKKSSKFTGHKRDDNQKKRISSSVKKMIDKIGRGIWTKHFGEFNGRSKVEIEFYNYIKENIDISVMANIPIGNYIVDIIKNKKIIEFYGDFWHANPNIFNKDEVLKDHMGGNRIVNDIWKKDEKRINDLKKLGYEVLVVWEKDWNKNKEKCIENIRKYII